MIVWPHPAAARGRIAIVNGRWTREVMDVEVFSAVRADEDASADGEIVWS
jgi:hypothetical protein